MWTTEKIEGYTCYIKHYEEGSVFGIAEGKISKLEIRKNNHIILSYDRGWDIEPDGLEVENVYQQILKKYN